MNLLNLKQTEVARAVPPHPPALPFLGSALGLARDPLGYLERISRAHGDVVRFTIPGQEIYLFNHPDAIEEVLFSKSEHLMKSNLTRRASIVLGDGLLTSDGPHWKRQRKLVQPVFNRSRMQNYAEIAVEYTERELSAWRDAETRDIHADSLRLALNVVARTLLGVEAGDVSERVARALDVLVERFSGIGTFVPIDFPIARNRRAKRALSDLDDIFTTIIRERRASGGGTDLTSLLIAARTEDGEAMDDRQLRDEIATLLLAGHETTALTLAFALFLLAQHPAAADALAQEVARVLGDRAPTADDVSKLPYAEGVVREAMRLYPAAWSIGREVVTPCEIAGYPVLPGTQLWVAQWIVQRDARWFPQPTAFRPARWTADFIRQLPKYAYFPFGGGPRLCIGKAFGMMEAVLMLVTITRRFRFESLGPAAPELVPTATLRPRHGLSVRCRALARAAG